MSSVLGIVAFFATVSIAFHELGLANGFWQ